MKYIVIENNLEKIKQYIDAGVERIMIDLELLDKIKRQEGLDSFITDHTIDDVAKVKSLIKHKNNLTEKPELMVRINHYNQNSKNEIKEAIKAGADIIMLPFIQNISEVRSTINIIQDIDSNIKFIPLIETIYSFNNLEEICKLPNITEIYLGLNDLHIERKMQFMFELLTDGSVEHFANIANKYNIIFGFGGIAAPNIGAIKAEDLIVIHAYLGSSMVILGRSFKNNSKNYQADLEHLSTLFFKAKKTHKEELQNIISKIKKNILALSTK